MKKKEKQGLLILILMSILILVVVWTITRKNKEEPVQGETQQIETSYVETQKDGTRVNTSEKIKEKRTIEGVTIENIKFTEKNGQTDLIANITNTTSEKKERTLIDIVLYDKSGNEMGTIPGILGEMQPGETIEMRAGITIDYINAHDFKIVKK